MSNDIVQQVKKTYSAIAEEFDATRKAPWPEFKTIHQLLKKFTGKVKILDIGCGNGRLFHEIKDKNIAYVGLDNNRVMLKIARKNCHGEPVEPWQLKPKFLFAEMTKLPFPYHSFDVVCCVATLHHLPTQKLQLQALKEMKRVCRKNGLCIITVWNLWQPKYKKFIQHATPQRGAINNKKKYHTEQDFVLFCALKKAGCHAKVHHAWIPWGNNKTKRFYYAFTAQELKKLLLKSGFTKIKKIPSEHNFAYLVE